MLLLLLAQSDFIPTDDTPIPDSYGPTLDYWWGWPLWIGLCLVSVAIVVFYVRLKWKALSPKLGELPKALVELQKPGICEERLSLAKVREILGACLHEACDTFDQLGQTEIAAWLRENGNDRSLPADRVRATCLKTLQTGAPQSLCWTAKDRYFYLIAFPGRYEHHQLLRRYGFLSQGWLRHAKAACRAIDPTGGAGVFCLMLFLSPDARDAIGVYAWEGSGVRLECARVLDDRERRDLGVQVFEQAYHVAL